MAGITERAAFNAAFSHLRQPFAWGLRSDCTAACVAFMALHGTDPLEGCADAYRTALGAGRILKRAGGYLAWCNATFDLATTTPKAGDLALIKSADTFGAALAICIKPGEYASKTEAGMVIVKADILGAWSCRF
tara:strand:+ start:69 stop:470 length:402 start_codon:yes stop_codon:yes gene_type:complete